MIQDPNSNDEIHFILLSLTGASHPRPSSHTPPQHIISDPK